MVETYALATSQRLLALRAKSDAWWREELAFFDVPRSRAWILVRRIAHTAHHRGQQTFLLRARGKPLFNTYGPTADTGGPGPDGAAAIDPFADTSQLPGGSVDDSSKQQLPAAVERAVTERPDA